MSARKAITEAYIDGFRQGDHAAVLACLTDDVVWDIPGHVHLAGKEAFDREIENDAFTGRPALDVDRLIEEGETVVVIGSGEARLAAGGVHRFTFCDVFTFRGDAICRVESYLVPLGAAEAAEPATTNV